MLSYQIVPVVTGMLEVLGVPEELCCFEYLEFDFFINKIPYRDFRYIFLQQKWVTTLDCMEKKVMCFMKIAPVIFLFICLHCISQPTNFDSHFQKGHRQTVSHNRTMPKMMWFIYNCVLHLTKSIDRK